MGKGDGEHPPEKFVNDQCFCEICIMCFMVASFTLSGLSAGMDDGGSFPSPYFFTGFILGFLLLANLVSRMAIVNTVKKKGLSKKNILDVLNNTTMGHFIWPWSCRIGLVWCIPGCILTGLGGVNCGIDVEPDGNETIRNNCYYDVEGDHGNMYKGLAIGILVMHVFSFVFLLLSTCTLQSVTNDIKEDPKRNAVAPSTTTTTSTSTTTTTASQVTGGAAIGQSTVASSASTTTTTTAIAIPSTTMTTPTAPLAGSCTIDVAAARNDDAELKVLKKQLDQRQREIERREQELAERERRIMETNFIPPPPSYSELMSTSN